MEIPNTEIDGRLVCIAPPEYARFARARYFWREFGRNVDEMTVREVALYQLFAELEVLHPQRFQKKAD